MVAVFGSSTPGPFLVEGDKEFRFRNEGLILGEVLFTVFGV
jgi:hypothetical protein